MFVFYSMHSIFLILKKDCPQLRQSLMLKIILYNVSQRSAVLPDVGAASADDD